MSGEYERLLGEVVTEDVYHIRDKVSMYEGMVQRGHVGIQFTPNAVIDLGANIGVFSEYVHSMFGCPVVAVEPNASNCSNFRIKHEDVVIINKAIGSGVVYKSPDEMVYLSVMPGYSQEYLDAQVGEGNLEPCEIEAILLTDLAAYFCGKVLLKVDIEGGENAILFHEESVEAMKTFDYIAMELHYFGETHEAVVKLTRDTYFVLGEFAKTHIVIQDHPFVYLTKK